MIVKRLVLGPLDTNCFIVACTETHAAVVIDPADDSHMILSTLEREKFEVKYILLTHAHIDHVGALSDVKNATDVNIVMGEKEKLVLKGIHFQAMFLGMRLPKIPKIDQYVNEGDVIAFGKEKLTVLETPGHTPGGVSYRGTDSVFVGDVLFAGSIGRTDLPGGSHKILLQSIRDKLLTLPDDTTVFCGHGPRTTIGKEKLTNPFLIA